MKAGLERGSSGHFLRVATRARRRSCVDHARAKKSAKRGGGAAEARRLLVLDRSGAPNRYLKHLVTAAKAVVRGEPMRESVRK